MPVERKRVYIDDFRSIGELVTEVFVTSQERRDNFHQGMGYSSQ